MRCARLLDFQGSRSLALPAAGRRVRQGRTTRTWQVEPLEDRRLLAGDFGFAVGFGSPTPGIWPADYGAAVATDAAGDVYVTGTFNGTADFDPGPATFNLTSGSGAGDGFVSKFGPAGNFLWARHLGAVWVPRIAVDAAGDVYVTGTFNGTADFDPGPATFKLTSAGQGDAFIMKLDTDGNFAWARRLGGRGEDTGDAITTDGSTNVYVVGTYGTEFHDRKTAFVVKLDTQGNLNWERHFYGVDNDQSSITPSGIAVDGSGEVYTTGTFIRTVDFDPGSGSAKLHSGEGDVFITKLSTTGSYLWAKKLDGYYNHDGSNDDARGIAVDSAGNAYVVGTYYDTVDFDPGSDTHRLTRPNDIGMYLLKLSAAGKYAWVRDLGSSGGLGDGRGVAVDGANAVYTTRSTPAEPSGAGFVTKVDGEGTTIWDRPLGGAKGSYVSPFGVAVDAAGDVYSTGSFSGTADFDPGLGVHNLSSSRVYDNDVFILKLTQQSPVAADIAVRDGNTVISNGATIDLGTTRLLSPVSKTLTIKNEGVDDLFLNPAINVPSGFTLVSGPGTTRLAPGTSTTIKVRWDARATGPSSGTLILRNNDPDESPFTITLVGRAVRSDFVRIIDDGGPGFSTSSYWKRVAGPGYQGKVSVPLQPADFPQAVWTFTNLKPGRYRVSATWPVLDSSSRLTSYTVSDDFGQHSIGPVAQTNAPSSFVDSGTAWEVLGDDGIYTLRSGTTLTVRLTYYSSRLPLGSLVADAVRIDRV